MIRRTAPPAAYAGIGSRDTPADALALMQRLAARLGALGYTLRSGGAGGADTAFAVGASGHPMEIYTPWRGFLRDGTPELPVDASPHYMRALELAAVHHPNWAACKAGARKLHARNMMQVLGPDLESPSEFVLCWTKTGGAHGGTGQAIRVAEARGVPVWNLQRPEHVAAVMRELSWAELRG